MYTVHLISDLEKGRFTQKGGISPVSTLKDRSAFDISAGRLKTFSEPEGRIRLSEDDGPPTHTFIEDDDEDDDEDLVLNTPQPLDRSGRSMGGFR
jgi:hypothetical protein